MDILEFGKGLLQFRYLILLIVIIDALLCLICKNSLFQECVVQFPVQIQLLIEDFSLIRRWIQSELICPHGALSCAIFTNIKSILLALIPLAESGRLLARIS